jgi:hypothetical protein
LYRIQMLKNQGVIIPHELARYIPEKKIWHDSKTKL